MTWMSVEIDGERAGVERKDSFGQIMCSSEVFAEDLETTKVIHATSGDFSCKHCGERWNEQDEDRDDVAAEVCPQNVCEDPECECGEHTHELEDAPMTWFEEAAIKVDQRQEEVSVSFEVNGKRFRMGVHYAANIGRDGTGALVLSFPGTSGTREVNGCTVVAD
jgi:hypothetical protein